MQTAMADIPRPPVSVAAARTAVAYPLVALAFLAVPVSLVAESVWAKRIALAAFQSQFGHSAASPLQEAGLAERVGALVEQGWFLLALTLVLLVFNRHRPAVWPVLTLTLTVPLGVSNSMGLPLGAERVPGVQGLLVGNPVLPSVLTVVAGYGLAWLGVSWLTTPITEDVARSQHELIVRLRCGGRLRLERNRLVLAPARVPSQPDRPARLAIPWRSVSFLQAGVIESSGRAAQWDLPNGVTVELPDGPALRIIGSGQQWIVPVDEQGRLTAAIGLRARRAAPPQAAETSALAEVSLAQWRHVRDLVATEHRRQRHNPLRGVLADRFDFYLTIGLLWLVLAGLSLPGFAQGWAPVYLLATVFFGTSATAVLRRWRSLARDTALFEANPREPGAPPWGETDPAEPPLPNWTAVRAGVVPEPS